jgi:hypothetical protein
MKYLLTMIVSIWATSAWALRCLDASELIKEAEAVFIGQLVSFDTNVDRQEFLLHYKVQEHLKGQLPEEVLILDAPPCMMSPCSPEEVRRAQEVKGTKDKPEVVLVYSAPGHPAFYRAWGLKPGDVHGEKRHCASLGLDRLAEPGSWRKDLEQLRRQRRMKKFREGRHSHR